ncbi:MAG: glycoside hydrolase family 55 protein, partial [Actinomycetota bacterium]|nr:glycoside hydrolase family 55 protein [Actinomycetota bacterium]
MTDAHFNRRDLLKGAAYAAGLAGMASTLAALLHRLISRPDSVKRVQLPLNVKDYGAVGDGVADDTAAIRAAMDTAAAEHAPVYFPPTPGGYRISSALTVSTDFMVLLGRGATVTQTAANTPGFDLNGSSDVTIEGFYLRSTTARTWSSASFRGDALYLYSAAVWASGERVKVRNVRVEGFAVGVMLGNWDFGTSALS